VKRVEERERVEAKERQERVVRNLGEGKEPHKLNGESGQAGTHDARGKEGE
jgi:hypothetical protein